LWLLLWKLPLRLEFSSLCDLSFESFFLHSVYTGFTVNLNKTCP
jgi:hypothetical protein